MDIVTTFKYARKADHVILSGGNARRFKRLPKDVRLGDNDHAFTDGVRLWEEAWKEERSACVVRRDGTGEECEL